MHIDRPITYAQRATTYQYGRPAYTRTAYSSADRQYHASRPQPIYRRFGACKAPLVLYRAGPPWGVISPTAPRYYTGYASVYEAGRLPPGTDFYLNERIVETNSGPMYEIFVNGDKGYYLARTVDVHAAGCASQSTVALVPVRRAALRGVADMEQGGAMAGTKAASHTVQMVVCPGVGPVPVYAVTLAGKIHRVGAQVGAISAGTLVTVVPVKIQAQPMYWIPQPGPPRVIPTWGLCPLRGSASKSLLRGAVDGAEARPAWHVPAALVASLAAGYWLGKKSSKRSK